MRALLPIPAALLAWLLVLLGSLKFEQWRVATFCPEGMREGSVCYADGWLLWPWWLVCSGAALSAVAVVWAAALAASGDRVRVARWAYLIGVIAAVLLGILLDYLLPAAVAILSGALATWFVARIGSAEAA